MTVAMIGAWTVVTGPPGAGKSTVAALLAADAAQPTVHLHTDSFYAWIRTGFVAPYLPESARQNEVVLDAITAAAAAYAHGGYDVVFDGVIGPWLVDRFRERAADAGVTMSYVVLAAPLEVALQRATERRHDRHLHDPEPITALHRAFADVGPWSRHVVQTANRTPDPDRRATTHALAYRRVSRMNYARETSHLPGRDHSAQNR